MLPPSRDRQAFPGAYAALDALDEAAVRESNAAASGALRRGGRGAGAGRGLGLHRPADLRPRRRSTATSRTSRRRCRGTTRRGRSCRWWRRRAPTGSQNEHYASEEEFVFALADALHEEYKAIVDAGLLLQVDDAVLMHECRHDVSRGRDVGGLPALGASCASDALNHALRGIPEDRVRYHVCWGSWHGPHAYDPPLRDVVDLMLTVNAGYYSMERPTPATSTSGGCGRT